MEANLSKQQNLHINEGDVQSQRDQKKMTTNVGTRRKRPNSRRRGAMRGGTQRMKEERKVKQEKYDVQLNTLQIQESEGLCEVLDHGEEIGGNFGLLDYVDDKSNKHRVERHEMEVEKRPEASLSSLFKVTKTGKGHKRPARQDSRVLKAARLEARVEAADDWTVQEPEDRGREAGREKKTDEGREEFCRYVREKVHGMLPEVTSVPKSVEPRQDESELRSSRKHEALTQDTRSWQQASPRADLPVSITVSRSFMKTKESEEAASLNDELIGSLCEDHGPKDALISEGIRSSSPPQGECTDFLLHPSATLQAARCPPALPIWTLAEEKPAGVRMATLTPRDVLDDSVVEVRVTGLRGEHGSVTDPRLGPLLGATGISCATCAAVDCLGHSGHIDLRQDVFHPFFVTRCVQTLRKLCYHCLGPANLCLRNLQKVQKAKEAQRRQLKMKEIYLNSGVEATVKEQPNPRLCNKRQPKFRVVVREGVEVVEVVVSEGRRQKPVELSASTVRAIFTRVPHRTWAYLGMKDPSDQVLIRYLRVCPSACRPATQVNGILSPCRLTVRYNKVIKLRNELDRLNLHTQQLLHRQDDMVSGGVCVLLYNKVDEFSWPGHLPGHAPAAAHKREQQPPVLHFTYNDENSDKVEEDETLPKDINFDSDNNEEVGDDDKEENIVEGLKEGEKSEGEEEALTFATPPRAEWLLSPDDEDKEEGISGRKEQRGAIDNKDNEDTWNDEELLQTERLRRLKLKVEEVAAQVCALLRQARQKRLLLAAAVAAVIQEQVSKVTGKQGVLRHHLLGKRVNQCARAVFTGDNSLPLGVVGVPRVVAAKLFQYVYVHSWNLKECEAMVARCPEYPSVVAVVRGERRLDLQALRNKKAQRGGPPTAPLLRLQPGDVVQRHLMDGDQVVVCRQPTLAKANMETHTVRVTDTRTISLNISITDNFAADCDGDEVNLFVPGVESHASRLLNVEYNAVFPKNGKVSLRIKQDALRGAYSASLRDTFLTREEFTALMPSDREVPPPALLKPRYLWTGLQLLSLALPPSLTVDQAGVAVQLDALLVRHGELLSGVFDKAAQDKILECCKMFYSRSTIMSTVHRLQGVAERFVDEVGGVGFTFVPEDWLCPASTLNKMREELHDALRHAQDIKCPLRRNAKLRQLLADQAKQLVPQLPKESNAAAMLKAGSKKRPQKLVQVCLAVGQHNQDDQLPAKDLDGRRLLPFFSRGDTRPQAEGFVDEPLLGVGSITADVLSGMVARSSSYKKHCATGESGYLQRKLGKLMEDLTVRHDGTVRDANDEIVQLLYGDDGLLPECCVTVTLCTGPLTDYVADFYLPLIRDRCLAREERRLLRKELWALWRDRHPAGRGAPGGPVEASVPFNLPHLMAHVLATVPSLGPPPSVADIVGSVNDFFVFLDHSIEKPLGEEARRRREAYEAVLEARRLQAAAAARAGHPLGPRPHRAPGGKLPEVNLRREIEQTPREVRRGAARRLLGEPLATLKRYVRQHVNTLSVRSAGFSRHQLSALLEAMRRLYQESRPAAGEGVGALAAQALAEPLMQMTLNACHRAAVASDGDAIPRLTELLNGQAEDALLELWQGGLLRARDYLVQEIGRVYTAAGEAVDVRHVRLVVDYMLKDGTMRGFTRHHVPPQASFLKGAAFEQPLSLLQMAGRRGRADGLRGVSENLILNEAVDVGPDTCDTLAWVGLREHLREPLSQQDASAPAGHGPLHAAFPEGWGLPDSDDELTCDESCPEDEAEAMSRRS